MGLDIVGSKAYKFQDDGERTWSGSIPIVYMRRLRVDAEKGEFGGDQALIEDAEGGENDGAARDTVHEGISTRNWGLRDGGVDGNDILFFWGVFCHLVNLIFRK